MRNLKRVLSLALASVMLMGMMVFGASAASKTAADLTDMDKVTNKEAVSLMVDLGIIVGKPDGSYAPAETVDRATMSKLIYFIMMGTADESAFKGVSTPLVDVKGNWAEGFINYCYSVKIVAGTGDNTFNPNGKVTVVSAAKMLLVALGYDAEASKYQNDAMWSVNIMRDAQSAGLLKNLSQKASEELTRDNAALMIYNALFASLVKPSFQIDMGVKYLNGYETIYEDTAKTIPSTMASGTYNLKKVTATVTANDFSNLDAAAAPKDGKTIVNVTAGATLGATTLDIASGANLLGRQVYYFINKNTSKVISTNLFETGKTKVFTTTWSDTSKNNTDYLSDNNLVIVSGTTKYSENYGKATATAVTPAVGDGVIYINAPGTDDGKVTYVVVTAYQFGVVTEVTASKGTFKVSGTKALPVQETSKVSGADGLKKGDFVTYYQVGGSYVFAKAESITGKLTALKTSSGTTTATIGGKGYVVAEQSALSGVSLSSVSGAQLVKDYITGIDLKKAAEGTYYLNKLGEVVVYVGEAADAEAQYALVTALKVSTDSWTGKKAVEAKIVLADGTQETVTVVDVANKTVATDADRQANLTNSLYDLATFYAGTATTNLGGKVYAYTVNSDGDYKFSLTSAQVTGATFTGTTPNFTLSAVTSVAGATTNLTSVSYTTGGKAEIKSGVLYANDKTTVLFYDESDPDNIKIKSYTGAANIPSFGAVTIVDYIPGANSSLYSPFILVKGSPAGNSTSKAYAYVLSTTVTTTADGNAYDVVIDGVKTTLTLAGTTDVGGTAIAKDAIYSYVTTDGVSKLTLINGAALNTGTVTNVTSEYAIIKVGGVNAMYYLAGAAISDLSSYNKDGKLVVGAGALSVGNTVKFAVKTVNSDNYVDAAYIIPGTFNASSTGNELTATGTTSGTTYTVKAVTDVTLENCYKFAYVWKVDGSVQAGQTSDTFTSATSDPVTCEVTIVSRLDGSVRGMDGASSSTPKTVTVSTFS